MDEGDAYDVFLSYASRDIEAVKSIHELLAAMGLRVWFDRDPQCLPPGVRLAEGLIAGMTSSLAAALMVGPAGPGHWGRQEFRLRLPDFVKKGRPVIPVVLPGGSWPLSEREGHGNEIFDHVMDVQPVDLSETGITPKGVRKLADTILGRRVEPIREQAFGTYLMTVTGSADSTRTIEVARLPNRFPSQLLDLNWHTFDSGVKRISHQIRHAGRRQAAHCCIGINEAGLTMATLLAGTIFDRCPIGYIRTRPRGEGRRIDTATILPNLPETAESPIIYLADFELKSGENLCAVIRHLRHHWGDSASIRVCVFGALVDTPDLMVRSLSELVAFSPGGMGEELMSLIDEIHIAATMGPPGIEPPLGLA